VVDCVTKFAKIPPKIRSPARMNRASTVE
jgi:hypothetical protein